MNRIASLETTALFRSIMGWMDRWAAKNGGKMLRLTYADEINPLQEQPWAMRSWPHIAAQPTIGDYRALER